MSSVLRYKKLSVYAYAPFKATKYAAGFDLRSAYDYVVPPMGREVIETDLQIHLPAGCYGRIAPRSGLAAQHFIDVGAGVVDSDYTGNVKIVLFNFGEERFYVHPGDRVAQLICEKIEYPTLEEVPWTSQLREQSHVESERGSNGFGWSEANA